MKFRISIILSVVCFLQANAQIILSGKILSEKNTAVSYAHISITNTGYGTITNSDGEFRLHLPSAASGKELSISCIGYSALNFLISESKTNLVFILKESQFELDAVVITPIDYARKLVMAAINNIPNNYPKERETQTSFSRAFAYADSTLQKPYYMIEGLFEAQKESYEKKRYEKEGYVKLLQSRKFEFQNIDSLSTRFYGGSHFAHWGDLIARRIGPLTDPNSYDFEILDTVILENAPIYEVSFDSKNGGRGNLFITDKSYAIAKMAWFLNKKEASNLQEDVLLAAKGYDRINKKYKAQYYLFDGKWRMLSANYSSTFTHGGEVKIHLVGDFVANHYKPQNDVIPYLERFDLYDPLILNIGEYDSSFWNDQNIILPNAEVKKMLDTQELNDASQKSKMEKILAVFSRIQLKYAIAGISKQEATGSIIYQNNIRFQDQFESQKAPKFGLISSLNYELKPSLFVGFEQMSSFQKLSFSANYFTLSYDYNLTPKSRPFYFTPIIKFGNLKLRESLETIRPESSFKANSKTFDANNVDTYFENRGISLVPSLALSIKLNSRYRFFVDGGRNIIFAEKQGLFLMEDQFFLKRKRAFITSSDETLTVQSTEKRFSFNKWSASFGIVVTL